MTWDTGFAEAALSKGLKTRSVTRVVANATVHLPAQERARAAVECGGLGSQAPRKPALLILFSALENDEEASILAAHCKHDAHHNDPRHRAMDHK